MQECLSRDARILPSPRTINLYWEYLTIEKCSLKEKTLRYTFTTTYCPGKWHQGADAISRNPTHSPSDSIILACQNASDIDIAYAEGINDQLHQTITSHIQTLEQRDNNPHPDINNYTISTKLEQECISDPTYQLLASTIENEFPNTQQKLDPKIRDYWGTRNCLTVKGNIILMDSEIALLISLRKYILSTLHAAHQGVKVCTLEPMKVSIGQDWTETLE